MTAKQTKTAANQQQPAPDVDAENPEIDADPRAEATDEQNRRDMNDPTISDQEAVERALKGE